MTDTYYLTDEGTIDGITYVTVLDQDDNPIEYNVPEDYAIRTYGDNLAPVRWTA